MVSITLPCGLTPMNKITDLKCRVLVVEDNLDIATLLLDYLADLGHIPDHAADGHAAYQLATENEYDAIILDWALPGMDGIEVCRKLRQEAHSSVTILMLTARDTLEDKLTGFDIGADDYLVKPFDLPEVEARLTALWRRTRHGMDTEIKVGDLILNTETFQVTRENTQITLNPVRLKILNLLMQQSHRVVSRQEIEAAVWGDEPTDSDALRTHMSAIRQAIDKPFEKKLLHTIHGIGYRLHDQPT